MRYSCHAVTRACVVGVSLTCRLAQLRRRPQQAPHRGPKQMCLTRLCLSTPTPSSTSRLAPQGHHQALRAASVCRGTRLSHHQCHLDHQPPFLRDVCYEMAVSRWQDLVIEHPLQAAVGGLLSLFALVERSLTHRHPTFDPRVRVWSCTSSYALHQEGPYTGRQSPSCTHCIACGVHPGAAPVLGSSGTTAPALEQHSCA
jgi:hypothetical protein